ncbi:prolyl oligopeptidase family serine peptidase [Telmatospirillum sp.]|uniref:prolyl oligopeptidase family serine peptidase n=1 Tax=Telmatospirillum sp. TaxID=2079197 RepID=UPI00284EDBA5|nr:prolyl oligopeptidase family serine peptidase [Telmatospirillum sp.]MDR3437575.1 prolyl oligopeptidase family serine peptidase [Telmatospirillum sp.]
MAFKSLAPASVVIVAGMLAVAAGPAVASDPGAPPTAVEPVVDDYHGTSVSDPYRWLEDNDGPRVRAWTDAENQRTRALLDAIPGRAALRDRLADLITGASGAWFELEARPGVLFAMHADPKVQQPLLKVMGLDADPAKGRVVLDPNKLDPSGGTTVDWYVPSPDGRRIAVSLSQRGSEEGTVHVFETKTGKDIGEAVPRVQFPTGGGSVAWRADGSGFWYTRYPGEERPEADRRFFQQIFYHRIGTDPAKDAYVLGRDFPKIAETRLDNRANGRLLLAEVKNGDGGEVMHFVLTEDGKAHQVTRFEDGVTDATMAPEGTLYLVSRQGSPNGRVLELAPGHYDLADAKEIVPAGELSIQPGEGALAATRGYVYVHYVVGGPSEVHVFDASGRARGKLPLPEVSAARGLTPLPGGDLLVTIGTYTKPIYTARFDAKAGSLTATGIAMTSPATFDDAEVLRAFATSKDGTRVPFTIVRSKGTPQDGSAPALLTGYGGYGIVYAPSFLASRGRVWLEHGGIMVIANIRGGGEYGDAWHLAGNLTKKQNVFDDFTAVAQALIDEHYTTPMRLAIEGGSNGGLLMGAALTQHPELFRAVVSHVGIYDMLRVELDPNGLFNVTEFGTVKDPDQFAALYAYSPYHHVVDGTAYPAVLLMAGEHDGRVNPMQSRKMAARLQAATGSDQPVLLLTSAQSGHGMGTALSVAIEQSADSMAFLFDRLGIK